MVIYGEGVKNLTTVYGCAGSLSVGGQWECKIESENKDKKG
jgi:hypothetical protein